MTNSEKHSSFLKSPQTYGESYQEHLMDQYKMYVDSAQRVSQLRASANNYLLTVNAFLVTLYGLASSYSQNQAWRYLVPVTGVLVCITWFALIRSYRGLNSAKFQVIHELEKHLPAALYKYEWDLAEKGHGKIYVPLTHIEQLIPILFMVMYVALAIYALVVPPTTQ